ncbi:sugar O-acetyltransferase [Corallincola holothuriorum]|uniref:Nodulation protein L n=1 Tax=Corallincola holothuriorum TaxID=2282215 RepID=A0A368NF02_9GAMM|nr:sugar O-acetyltransferase [Corallincola holothuriorum]RCU49227.1 sugar O-acetyltransferase [Corallincola holothuriorum]
MTEYEKMLNGELFNGGDAEVARVRDNAFTLLKQINHHGIFNKSKKLFRQLLGELGQGSIITPPFRCEFGQQIRLGERTFLNMNVLMLDGATITLGNHVLVGPNVQFYTASHSMDYESRRRWETFCKPITVEDDVWIGGNVVINQGVTIGARSIIAANSVINHDVPADTLVGGAPARVIRSLLEKTQEK